MFIQIDEKLKRSWRGPSQLMIAITLSVFDKCLPNNNMHMHCLRFIISRT